MAACGLPELSGGHEPGLNAADLAPHDHRRGSGALSVGPAKRGSLPLDGELPLIEGTLIRLKADHLLGDRDAPPVWLWS